MTELSDTIVRQLEAIRTDIALLDQKQDAQIEDLAEVKKQTTATNGRVTALELWQARLAGAAGATAWRPAFFTGLGLAGFAALAAALAAHFIH